MGLWFFILIQIASVLFHDFIFRLDSQLFFFMLCKDQVNFLFLNPLISKFLLLKLIGLNNFVAFFDFFNFFLFNNFPWSLLLLLEKKIVLIVSMLQNNRWLQKIISLKSWIQFFIASIFKITIIRNLRILNIYLLFR